jgi:hypothetical protein
MRVKDDFFQRGSFVVRDGMKTRFWEDTWLGDSPLATQYPNLYNIASNKQVLVADVLSQVPLNIGFNRTLTGDRWNSWIRLLRSLMEVNLSDEPDIFKWRLTTTGIFSVKSMYADYMNGHTVFLKKYLWKIKVPLKIRIFMWFLYKKVILTKDNLAKRRWTGCTKCVFCGSKETIDHLFISCHFSRLVWRVVHFTFNIPPPSNITNLFGNLLNGIDKKTKERIRVGVCALVWTIWNCRNEVVFNRSANPNFLQVIHRAASLIHLWSYLLPVEQREPLATGCNRLMAVVRAIFNQGGWLQSRRIEDAP